MAKRNALDDGLDKLKAERDQACAERDTHKAETERLRGLLEDVGAACDEAKESTSGFEVEDGPNAHGVLDRIHALAKQRDQQGSGREGDRKPTEEHAPPPPANPEEHEST